jgi:hypothetical protein
MPLDPREVGSPLASASILALEQTRLRRPRLTRLAARTLRAMGRAGPCPLRTQTVTACMFFLESILTD